MLVPIITLIFSIALICEMIFVEGDSDFANGEVSPSDEASAKRIIFDLAGIIIANIIALLS